MLLSTEPVVDFEAAVEKLRWYLLRWGIEVFHRVLKSGCKIETRRLGNADRLEDCLGIDMVVAWRIYHLTKLGREAPTVPCTVYFEEHEWQALVAFVTRQPEPPKDPRLCVRRCGWERVWVASWDAKVTGSRAPRHSGADCSGWTTLPRRIWCSAQPRRKARRPAMEDMGKCQHPMGEGQG
jgi:hypothetical protein